MSKFKITVEEQITYTYEIEVETVLSELAVDKFLDVIEDDLTTKDDVEVICTELKARDVNVQSLIRNGDGKRSGIRVTELWEDKE